MSGTEAPVAQMPVRFALVPQRLSRVAAKATLPEAQGLLWPSDVQEEQNANGSDEDEENSTDSDESSSTVEEQRLQKLSTEKGKGVQGVLFQRLPILSWAPGLSCAAARSD